MSAVEGNLRKMNEIKNGRRNKRFYKKIGAGFRDLGDKTKKVILAEGDSWFNYPIILTDLIDRIAMEENFAVLSLASGGDWLLNMLTARQYVEGLSVLHPDVFLISGGGNDLVGSNRLAAMIDPDGCNEYEESEWAKRLIKNAEKKAVPLDVERFRNGVRLLSKDFFALLMFFHLQYYDVISRIVVNAQAPGDKFFGIQIITQGYDYAIPSYQKRFGVNPVKWYLPFIRFFLGHGGWLKTPMLMRGIRDQKNREDLVYAMIYLFNEMMIDIGTLVNREDCCFVSHIDSRGSLGRNGWADELHPMPAGFIKTGDLFVACINKTVPSTYGNVYVVNPSI